MKTNGKLLFSLELIIKFYFTHRREQQFLSNYQLSLSLNLMAQRNQTALQKMQQIANRLISNTPQLAKMLQNDSLLKPKRPSSPTSYKKGSTSSKSGVSNPQILNYNKSQMTANDYHEKCKQLTQQLITQKDKCQQLEDEIGVIKQRFVERQIQYRKIIEELQDEIKSKSILDVNDRNRMQNIKQLHSQIISNISSIQSKTSKILIEQQSDIRRFFHKKINQIKEKFKEDKINKTQKDQEYQIKQKQMMSELDWIKNIAHKIDAQNQQMVKKYTTLKSEFQIQEKDKEILLKELLMKKKQNAVLKAQVEQYQKLLNEVSKQMQQQEMQQKSFLANQQLQVSSPVTKLPSVKAIKKSSTSNLLQNSRASNKDSRYVKDSRAININVPTKEQIISSTPGVEKKYESTISHLKNIIMKEKRKVKDLKNLYMRQIGMKSQLQKIIRKLVDDVRESIVQVEKERRKKRGVSSSFGVDDEINQQGRQQLLQKLLSNEKVLTLIYDKTFYANNGNNKTFGASGPNNLMMKIQDVPEQIKELLQDDDSEGFV